jgi:capsular polysaccharide biosynthesis protein
VDFWDLTKLLARRWWIMLPMLALSAGLSVLTVLQVKPDYVVTGYVQLVPPVLEQTKPGQATPDQRNPWLGLGLQTIGNAAIVTVQDASVVQELTAAGLSDSFTLSMGQSTPLITIEVVGKNAQQAQDTAEQLVLRFTQSVAKLQSDYGVSKSDSITARRLDLGTNVKVSNSKVKRAAVAVAGAGLLMTAGVTVGVDALLRRRRRRREDAAAPPRRTPAWGLPPSGTSAMVPNPGRQLYDRAEPDLTAALPTNGATAGTANGGDASVGEPIPMSSDETVVLPRLPEKVRWPKVGREKKSPADKA